MGGCATECVVVAVVTGGAGSQLCRQQLVHWCGVKWGPCRGARAAVRDCGWSAAPAPRAANRSKVSQELSNPKLILLGWGYNFNPALRLKKAELTVLRYWGGNRAYWCYPVVYLNRKSEIGKTHMTTHTHSSKKQKKSEAARSLAVVFGPSSRLTISFVARQGPRGVYARLFDCSI